MYVAKVARLVALTMVTVVLEHWIKGWMEEKKINEKISYAYLSHKRKS